MKNRKTLSKFLMLALAVGLLGVVSATGVLAQEGRTTSTQISNIAPAFTAHTTESWTQAYAGTATTDSRTESSGTYPTNEGTSVNFTATATDSNNDNYYLIVCETAGVTAANNAAPSCTGTQICASTSTASGVAANCAKSTTGLSSETYNWYSYVCDHNGASTCSSASNTSQGGTNDEVGAGGTPTPAGSPYHVNHAPTFTAATITDSADSTIAPGDTVKFSNSVDADADTQGAQDTINLYICSGEADQGGVTTAFDFDTNTCTGGTLLCSQTGVNPSSADATCNDTQDIVSIPTAHATDYTVKYYVEDGHSFNAAAVESKDYEVTDVAPALKSYTTIDSVEGLIAVGGSDTLTRIVTLTDDNGDNDPTLVDLVFFDASVTSDACVANERNCYRFDNEDLSNAANCTVTDRSVAGTGKTAAGTDNQLSASCDFTIWFNANASANWEVSATATDGTGDSNFANSDVNSIVSALSGIGVTEASIAYGTVAVGGDSSGQTTTIENMGNQIFDVSVSGTDMTTSAPVHTIAAAQQKWHHTSSTFDWATGGGFALVTLASSGDESNGCLNRDIDIRSAHASGASSDEAIFWKIRIPAAQESGSYTGTTTFSTTDKSNCTGTLY